MQQRLKPFFLCLFRIFFDLHIAGVRCSKPKTSDAIGLGHHLRKMSIIKLETPAPPRLSGENSKDLLLALHLSSRPVFLIGGLIMTIAIRVYRGMEFLVTGSIFVFTNSSILSLTGINLSGMPKSIIGRTSIYIIFNH